MITPNMGRGAQIYLSFLRDVERLTSLPKPYSGISWIPAALWRAVWLGMLDADDLNEITRAFYAGRTGFESEEFNIHQGLWPWEEEAVREHFVGKKHILVAGAGGGREVIALARLGYQVTGFDFSPYLIAAGRNNAKRAGVSADMLLSPPNGVPEGLGLYDALLIGRGFYHHIPGRTRRLKFLRICRDHLQKGAPFILSDFFTRPDSSRFHTRTQVIANLFRRLRNQSERVELGDWLSNCMQHAFVREEIERELLEAGFQPEGYRITPFSEDSRLAHLLGCVVP